MCDPLGKNLLLPSWFAEDFEEEASSLEIFFFFFLGVLDSLGKIFYFLTGNTLGKNLLIPHWGLFKCSWANQGRIFCLLHRDDIHYGKNF